LNKLFLHPTVTLQHNPLCSIHNAGKLENDPWNPCDYSRSRTALSSRSNSRWYGYYRALGYKLTFCRVVDCWLFIVHGNEQSTM